MEGPARHPVLARVDRRPLPHPGGAALGRPLCRLLLALGWRVRVHGPEQVPRTGPVLLAGNHIGVFDGPVLFGTCPRPTHVLAKREVFVGPIGPVLRGVGQIPLDRLVVDYSAVFDALAVLRAGRALGVYPEGERGDGDFSRIKSGPAYLALRTGAPIVPVACFGSVRDGQSTSRPPRLRSPVDIVYGEPFTVCSGEPWGPSLPRHVVAEASEQVRQHLIRHLSRACDLTGHPLPGADPGPARATRGVGPVGTGMDREAGPAGPGPAPRQARRVPATGAVNEGDG